MKTKNFKIACLKQVYKQIIGFLVLFLLGLVTIILTLKEINFVFLKTVLFLHEFVLLAIIFGLLLSFIVFLLEPTFAVNSTILRYFYDFTEKYRKAQESLDSTSNL